MLMQLDISTSRGWAVLILTATVVALCLLAPPRVGAVAVNAALEGQRANALPLTAFYSNPTALPGTPGALIRSESFDHYELPGGVRAVRIAYQSVSADGHPLMATGVVLIPYGKPPAEGWPVVAWAHGTAGVARICAPSLMKDLYYGWAGLLEYPMLGFAVVATDYAGLGSEGEHQYMSMQAQAQDVLNAIPAARSAVPELARDWVAIGHSQGGTAVLHVTELERRLGDKNFLGAISLAPPTDLTAMWHAPTPAGDPASGYLAIIASGIRAADPTFNYEDMLTPLGMAKLGVIRGEACLLAATSTYGKVRATSILQPGWADSLAVKRFSEANRPDIKAGNASVLVLQGLADSVISPAMTERSVDRMCRQGAVIDYRTYPGMDHEPLIDASFRDQIDWLRDRFAHRPAHGCGAPAAL